MSIDHDPLVIADEGAARQAAEQTLELLGPADLLGTDQRIVGAAAEAAAIDNARSGEHRHRLADLLEIIRDQGLRAEIAERSPSSALERLEDLERDHDLQGTVDRLEAALPAALQTIDDAIEAERHEASERFARGEHLPRSRGEIGAQRRSSPGRRRPQTPRDDPLDESLFGPRRG